MIFELTNNLETRSNDIQLIENSLNQTFSCLFDMRIVYRSLLCFICKSFWCVFQNFFDGIQYWCLMCMCKVFFHCTLSVSVLSDSYLNIIA